MKEKQNEKKSKGITLISLVVTIIVLLILAGVSIAMLTGDNGILSQANKAKKETEDAQAAEEDRLDEYENYINKATGNEITQVEDRNPGVLEGNGTEQEPFVINSIEDLVAFSNNVTNGNNYEGKYVELGQSLDFNSNLSYIEPNRENYEGYVGKLKTALTTGEGFKPIGITTEDNSEKNFAGTFNGKGNSINNLYVNIENMDVEFKKVGLFAINYGKITNIYLNNVNIYVRSKYPHVGAIAGQNGQGNYKGIIANYGVTGTIKMYGLENGIIGGITSYNSGTIKNGYNGASVVGEWENIVGNSIMGIGGIASSLGSHEYSQIIESYNEGQVIATINMKKYNVDIGGIVGFVMPDGEGRIINCYNSGKIIVNNESTTTIGGIVGKLYSGTMTNCYNVGEIQFQKSSGDEIVGMLVGENVSIVQNSYYKKYNDYLGIGTGNQVEGITLENDIIKSENEMKSDSFVALLNVGSSVWKRDNSKNNGYPILSWE